MPLGSSNDQLSVAKPAVSTQRASEPEGHSKEIIWSAFFFQTNEETKTQGGEKPAQQLPRGRVRDRILVSPSQSEHSLYCPLGPLVGGTHV